MDASAERSRQSVKGDVCTSNHLFCFFKWKSIGFVRSVCLHGCNGINNSPVPVSVLRLASCYRRNKGPSQSSHKVPWQSCAGAQGKPGMKLQQHSHSQVCCTARRAATFSGAWERADLHNGCVASLRLCRSTFDISNQPLFSHEKCARLFRVEVCLKAQVSTALRIHECLPLRWRTSLVQLVHVQK